MSETLSHLTSHSGQLLLLSYLPGFSVSVHVVKSSRHRITFWTLPALVILARFLCVCSCRKVFQTLHHILDTFCSCHTCQSYMCLFMSQSLPGIAPHSGHLLLMACLPGLPVCQWTAFHVKTRSWDWFVTSWLRANWLRGGSINVSFKNSLLRLIFHLVHGFLDAWSSQTSCHIIRI